MIPPDALEMARAAIEDQRCMAEAVAKGISFPGSVLEKVQNTAALAAALIEADAEMRRMREEIEALREFRKEAIVLTDGCLDTFRNYKDSDSLYSWDAGKWRRVSAAAKRADAARSEPHDG